MTGLAPNNNISWSEHIYFNNLYTIRCELPREFRLQLDVDCSKGNAGLIGKLKDSVDSQSPKTQQWTWNHEDLLRDYKRSKLTYAQKKASKKLADISEAAHSQIQKLIYSEYFHLENLILDLIYQKNENLLRAKQVFQNVKQDMIKFLGEFRIPESLRKSLITKIKTVGFSLPYTDPRRFEAHEDCALSEENAYYKPSKNSVTVCIGYINSYQSEGHLYNVLAHELSHAIDPQQMALDSYKQTEVAKGLAKVYRKSGRLQCDEWRQAKKKHFHYPTKIVKWPVTLQNLSACLVNRTGLESLDLNSIQSPAKYAASESINRYANIKAFSLLSQKTNKDGSNNEYFLNPQLLTSKQNFYFYDSSFESGLFHIGSVFVQELTCSENPDKLKAFEEAILETERLLGIYKALVFSFVGRNSEQLQDFDLARTVDEEWADWVAANLLERKLVKLEENRDLFFFESLVKFCKEDSLLNISTKKLQIERRFSDKSHPLNVKRRRFFIPSTIEETLKCKDTRKANTVSACNKKIIKNF